MVGFLKKVLILILLLIPYYWAFSTNVPEAKAASEKISISINELYWFSLDRELGKEILYFGLPGDTNDSKIVREFQVKTGASWSPTPLPQLLDRQYWLVVNKEPTDNPETGPYFLKLDVPNNSDWPYGPSPYTECSDVYSGLPIQCDWIMPGDFGLHGVNGNLNKLSDEDYGSSGCVRHRDEDITYLFNLLDPSNEEIRYYIIN